MPEEGRIMGKWRNFKGKQYRCDNCLSEFELKEKHKKNIVEKEEITEDGNEVFPVFFVKCPDCNNLIPLAEKKKCH